MHKKTTVSLSRVILISFVMLFSIAAISSATDIIWDNGGGDRDWNNPTNWNPDGVPPSISPYYVKILIPTGPILSTGDTATAYRVLVDGSNGSVTMDGGTINLTGSYVGVGYAAANSGTLTFNSGTINTTGLSGHLYCGVDGTGVLNMSGGAINLSKTLYIGRDPTGVGTVNLSGGTITCATLLIGSLGGTGTVDIGTGTLIIDNAGATELAAYIADGRVKAYGGAGAVDVDTTTSPGYTIVTAMISDKATFPDPESGTTDVPVSGTTLGWKPGVPAASHNVYFGTALNDVNNAERLGGDLDGDGTVDFKDVSRLTLYWLADPAGTEPYAGVNDDDIVDFVDYTLLARDWKDTAAPIFKGNQDANTFNPGTLAFITTYYWRIDKVNGPNTVKGNVWNFTTQSGKASDPSPADNIIYVAIDATLNWSASTGATSHDVYFGTTNPPIFQINQTGTTYNPGTLAQSTTYYWRIDEVGGFGTIQGDVWSFTTTPPIVYDINYTLVGKIMCGYQGWFNTLTDGANRGWVHWGAGSFAPASCTVDMWPDMTEYGPTEKFLAPEFYDGTNHYVFSSYKRDTVLRHFLWMAQYGIDGVFLQRFATEVTPGTTEFNHRNAVLSHCKEGANTYGRKYAVMYDLSGLQLGGTSKVINDWKYLVDTMQVGRDLNDCGYMIHKGKPVVAVWGIGWTDRDYTWDECLDLVNFLKDDPNYGGNTVMVGVRDKWRKSYITDPIMLAIVTKADIISPWSVGGYKTTSDISSYASDKWVPDKAWCNANGKDYLPVIWPGFSWSNLQNDPSVLNRTPRRGGQMLWDQVNATINTVGTNMIYVAMFDEVDEATAIFKVTNDPPRPGGVDMFVTYDIDGYPLPSDEYLWLTGEAGKGLRGEIPVNATRPAR